MSVTAIMGLIVLFAYLSTTTVGHKIVRRFNPVPEVKPKVKLSWPAKTIMALYNQLPEANQTMNDILPILEALDVFHGKEVVDEHFSYYDYFHDKEYRWACCSQRPRCIGGQYINIGKEIGNIQDALNLQEHALKISAVSHDLSRVEELTNRLRQEHEIINDITKELA